MPTSSRGVSGRWRADCRAQYPCGSGLACDAGTSVYPLHRGDAIAGKPAPTFCFPAFLFHAIFWAFALESPGCPHLSLITRCCAPWR
ncbi:hypothetical protein DA482_12110 [Pseudomonas fluorescens]|nr:hypothetical protein FIP59_20665 [Pseudomonas fluorescens]